jgi:hypothetical protein
MNGTIKEINLNSRGTELRTKLVNDKASLICIFEEIFGSNKPPNTLLGVRSEINFGAQSFSAAETNPRAGLKSASMAFRSKTRTARPPLVKSMQNFNKNVDNTEIDRETSKESANPLKMVKEYKTQHLKASVGK